MALCEGVARAVGVVKTVGVALRADYSGSSLEVEETEGLTG